MGAISSKLKGMFSLKLFCKERDEFPVYVFIIVYAAILSYCSILRHYAFMTNAWDLGIYEQTLWSTLNHRRLFWYTSELWWNKGGSFFGTHFSPILFFVLPIYALYQSSETLLILQSFMIALGALPLYWLTREELNKTFAYSLVGMYLLYVPLIGANLFDFHVQTFLPALYLFAFYYFKRGRWLKYFISLILSLMVIEIVPSLTAILLGLYFLWAERGSLKKLKSEELLRNRRALYSIVTIILAASWLVLAVSVIYYFNPMQTPSQFNPFVGLFPYQEKFLYVIGLFAPVAFLSFLDPASFSITLAWLIPSLLSNVFSYYTPIGFQYPAFIASFVFISAIYGIKRLKRLKKGRIADFIVPHKIFVISISCSLLFYFLASQSFSAIGVTHIPRITEHNMALRKVIALIPPDASVATQPDIFPHLAQRINAYPYYIEDISGDVDYIIVDTFSGWYAVQVNPKMASMDKVFPRIIKNGSYGLVTAVDGIYLLNRGYTGEVAFPFEHGLIAEFYNRGLVADFYNNENLSGESVFRSLFTSLNINWSLNSPSSMVNSDHFSVIFRGYLYVPEDGNYTLWLSSNDGSRLYIDEKLLLDGWGSHVYNGSVTLLLKRGFHKIRIDYIKTKSYASLHLYWKPPWRESIEILDPYLSKEPVSFRSVYLTINIDWLLSSPYPIIDKDNFTGVFTGYLYASKSGEYTFRLVSDDQSRFYVDNKLIFDCLSSSSCDGITTIQLEWGFHKIRIDYIKTKSYASLHLYWKPPWRESIEIIPSEYFTF